MDTAFSGGMIVNVNEFWLARMVYRFAVISPVLWLLGSLAFSFCLLLAAFSL